MAAYQLIDLEPPNPQKSNGTFVSALNNKKQTAGYSSYHDPFTPPDPSIGERADIATVWTAGGGGKLLDSPGEESFALGTNDSGAVVGYYNSRWFSPQHGFLFQNGTMTDLGPILGTDASMARDINNAGLVVGWAGTHFPIEPFVYNSATQAPPTLLGNLPGHDATDPQAINNNGLIVGTSSKTGTGDRRGFLYQGGAMLDLGAVFAVRDISDPGLIVGAVVFGSSPLAAVYDLNDPQPQFKPIGHLPVAGHDRSGAHSVNSKGHVVGSSGGIGVQPSGCVH